MGRILLCDDEESFCRSLGRNLRSAGHEVVTQNGEQGLARLRQERFDLILTDIRMPDVSGFDILAAARLHAPGTPVIAMSGSAEIPDAVRAMHAGARDFLIKPFETRTLEESVAALLKPAAPEPEPDALAWRDKHAPWLLGNDASLLPALGLLAQVADTGCTVLITGASGTGKELVARSLHAGSAPQEQAVRGGELRRHPLEPGRVGAVRSRQGLLHRRVERADRPVHAGRHRHDLPRRDRRDGDRRPGQAAAPHSRRRALPRRRRDPHSASTSASSAATNRNLEREVAAGKFRADLYWRLNVIPVELPSLRERPGDIALLADHFLRRSNERNKRAVIGFEPNAMGALEAYHWPGNIRELENLVERLVIVSARGRSRMTDLPQAVRTSRALTPSKGTPILGLLEDGTDLRAMLEAVEDRMIGEALERTGGNKKRAAELLGLNRTTLVEKLRRKRVA